MLILRLEEWRMKNAGKLLSSRQTLFFLSLPTQICLLPLLHIAPPSTDQNYQSSSDLNFLVRAQYKYRLYLPTWVVRWSHDAEILASDIRMLCIEKYIS